MIRATGSWINYNPEATAQYGAGFARGFRDEIVGGYYSKNESLYDYYQNAQLGFQACYDDWDCETVEVVISSRGSAFEVPIGGSAQNPVYLSLRVRRSTGVLSIRFRDYPEGGTTYTSLKGEGVLTPYFQDVPELSEFGAQAYILNKKTNDDPGYSYSESTPLVLTESCGCND